MTKALKKAFEAASRLPDREQDELATAILEELAADERWEQLSPSRSWPLSVWPRKRSKSIGRAELRPSILMPFDL